MKTFRDYSLRRHNTFGIDARCARFIEYASEAELRTVLSELRERPAEPVFHIGGGSNLLFTADYPGTLLHSGIKGREVTERAGDHVLVRAGAAEEWDDFVAWCVDNGFYGLENLSLIPGEVGASAVQNIGAYGVEAESCIERVETAERSTGMARTFRRDECEYAYRNSVFKHRLRNRYVVTHVVFRLSLRFVPQTGYGALQHELDGKTPTPQELRSLVIGIRRSKLPDPAVTGSAGSFFMNPVIPEQQFATLLREYPDAPHYPAPGGIKVPAGWLIERSGWKGKSLGRAGVHPRQALVLINRGGATGQEIVALSDAIRADVARLFGINLRPEVQILP